MDKSIATRSTLPPDELQTSIVLKKKKSWIGRSSTLRLFVLFWQTDSPIHYRGKNGAEAARIKQDQERKGLGFIPMLREGGHIKWKFK